MDSVLNGTLFHLCNAARYTYRNGRLNKRFSYKRLIYKIFNHLFRKLIIGNNALFKRSYCRNVSRRSSEHISCRRTDLQHLAGVLVNGNHRRLIEHNSLSLDIHKHIRRSEVNADGFTHSKHFKHNYSPYYVLFYYEFLSSTIVTPISPSPYTPGRKVLT